jgi:hypothetical protein
MEFTCSMPSEFPKIPRFLAGVALFLLFATDVSHSQDCGARSIRQARKAALRRAGVAALRAIQEKNTEGVLSYVGHTGLAFGVDKSWLSRQELRNQFSKREGAYCLFFSTACIGEMGRFKGLEPDQFLSKWKISYVEWLGTNKTYATDTELLDDDGGVGCGGYFSANTKRETKGAPNSIELYFNFEEDRWWLVDTVNGVP